MTETQQNGFGDNDLGRQADAHELALDEMAAEVESLRGKAVALELEVKRLRRELRRTRRNIGYRVTHGTTELLRAAVRLIFRTRSQAAEPIPVYSRSPIRERPSLPCSAELLALTHQLGAVAKSVFYLAPSPRNDRIHKHFAGKQMFETCRPAEDLMGEMTANRLFSDDATPLNGSPNGEFTRQELVIVDAGVALPPWSVFIGRLWPHQRVLFHGAKEDIQKLIGDHVPDRQGSDFAVFFAPPLPWLDPRHPSQPAVRPWKSARKRLAATLPSGRPWPRISIVTPTYNQGSFIEATIQSVLRQNYPELEYLVLDGGSNDGTQRVLEKYQDRLSYCCSQKDEGQADAINKGFQRSTGEILAWLNSDDLYATDALVRVAAAFDTYPEADIVVGGCGLLHDPSASVASIHHSKLPLNTVVPLPLEMLLDLEQCWLKGHFFYQPEVFWRRQIWEAVGATVSKNLYYSFDYELWVRMAQAGAKVVHVPDLVSWYRVHPAQKTFGSELPYVPELRSVNVRLRKTCARTFVL